MSRDIFDLINSGNGRKWVNACHDQARRIDGCKGSSKANKQMVTEAKIWTGIHFPRWFIKNLLLQLI